jgi:hypothetical protein
MALYERQYIPIVRILDGLAFHIVDILVKALEWDQSRSTAILMTGDQGPQEYHVIGSIQGIELREESWQRSVEQLSTVQMTCRY